VLIKSIEPFVVFIAKENMGRFCVEDYKVPTGGKFRQNDYA